MINIKQLHSNIAIEYPYGDTFEFAITEDTEIESGRRLRFQISPNGNPKTIIIEKMFAPDGNAFVVSLTGEEAKKLELNNTYEYRLTYHEANGTVATTLSGTIYVQWGAPNKNAFNPSIPTIHVGSMSLDRRMTAHQTAEVIDHPDGSVTARKISDKAISSDKLAEDVKLLINSNKFDGKIHVDAGDDFDIMEFPPGETLIYKLEDGYDLAGNSGILIVRWEYDYVDGDYIPAVLHQTKIMVCGGKIWNRHSLAVDGNRATAWLEWEAVNASPKQLEELSLEVIKLGGRLATNEINFEQDLSEIKSNISTLDDHLMLLDNTTVIRNTMGGESIAMPDSIEAPLRDLKVMGKTEQVKTNGYQLFDASQITSKTIAGVTITNNGDGSFDISGSLDSTVNGGGVVYTLEHDEMVKLIKAGNLTIYARDRYGDNPYLYVQITDGTNKIQTSTSANTDKGRTLEIPQDILDNENYYAAFGIFVDTKRSVDLGTIKPMVYQDGDGTWEPYTGGVPAPNVDYPQELESVGDDGSVDVNAHGYQLFDQLSLPSGGVNNSVQVVNNGDGSFNVSNPNENGSTYSYELEHDDFVRLFKTGKVTITGGGDDNSYAVFIIRYNNAVNKLEVNTFKGESRSIEIPDNIYNDPTAYAVFGIYSKPRTGSITIKPMVYQDGDGTWEQYKPVQTLPVQIMTQKIFTDAGSYAVTGLHGVPVSSGGNYTDESGQQWICDEIDYDRSVYVMRCGMVVYDGTEQWGMSTSTNNEIFTKAISNGKNRGSYKDYLVCSHAQIATSSWDSTNNAGKFASSASNTMQFGYIASKGTYGSKDAWKAYLSEQYANGTPITVIYELAEPIETPLSEEEINAYKALHAHYPSTSIHNSDNAHMVVDYVADTKNYVDNKIKKEIAELKALVLEA